MGTERAQALRALDNLSEESDPWQQSSSIPIRNKEPLPPSQEDYTPCVTQQITSSIYHPSNWKSDPAPDKPSIKPSSFNARDVNAIQYTKSLLNEGDTLVIVRFPNNIPVYDPTGFQLSDTHRVNSHKLKAASPVFKKALEDEWQQHRFRRRNKLIGNLPLALSELSCSLGIRRWYKSEFSSVAASHGLVGGQDETTVHPNYLKKAESVEVEHDINNADTQMRNDTIDGRGIVDGDTDEALEQKLQENNASYQKPAGQQNGQAQPENEYTKSHIDKDKEIETLDYCPIRHRTGIERLLQIIEGKDPRLDSAPKVWTLAVLAAHFECASSVVDYIVTWMIAEPNCKIFEILPEDCLRIGLMLQNEVATGYAFTILVSEEALRVGTSRSDIATQPNANYAAGKQVTKFGRARESLDEDTLNLIQHAGRNFHARIEEQVTNLTNANMNWLFNLPEFGKILKIKQFLESHHCLFRDQKMRTLDLLINELTMYVRGRLLWCFYQPLDASERLNWKEHRAQEQHLRDKGASISDTVHNELVEHEKILTRSFWGLLRMLKWSIGDARCATNLIRDQAWPQSTTKTVLDARAAAAADSQGIEKVFCRSVESSADAMNKIVFDMIRDEDFNDGQFPSECFMVEQVTSQFNDITRDSGSGTSTYDKYEYQRAQKTDVWAIRPEAAMLVDTSTSTTPLPLFDEKPARRISDAKKLAFWQEALQARDEAIARDGEGAEYSPEIKTEESMDIPDTWQQELPDPWDIDDQPTHTGGESSCPQPLQGHSRNWAKLQNVWNREQESKNLPTVPIHDPTSRDDRSTGNRNVSWSVHPSASMSQNATMTRTVFDSLSSPHLPRTEHIRYSVRPTPFFSLGRLFEQIDSHLSVVSTRMLSRGLIQDVRPPTCDICDTLLCLGDDEYKYLPLWAGGLNDGTGGVFEEAIPPAERGGAMGPGPAYRTGSTAANSFASSDSDSGFGFEHAGGSERWTGSETDSVMGGVNTSIGVEDGYSVDHIDRRCVFSEAEFPTPTSSEFGGGDGSVVFVGDEDVQIELPIRNKGKERAVDVTEVADDFDFVETSFQSSPAPGLGATEDTKGKGKRKSADFGEGDGGEWSDTKRVMAASLAGFGPIEQEQKMLMALYGGKGKGREVDKKMVGIQSRSQSGRMKSAKVDIEDDENFFNTAGDDEEFDFESDDDEDDDDDDDDGGDTETEVDFEHVD